VGQTAIECPVERAELSFYLHRDLRLRTPRALSSEGWICFGFHRDLERCSSQRKRCSISWASYSAWIAIRHSHWPASPWTSALPRWSTVRRACMPCCHTVRSDNRLMFRAVTDRVRRLRVPRRWSVERGECQESPARFWLRSVHSLLWSYLHRWRLPFRPRRPWR
jgi:hypothetical protein